MSHPFAQPTGYHYQPRISHVYASPTMVGTFGESPRVSRALTGRLAIHETSTINSSEVTLSPIKSNPASSWKSISRVQFWRRVGYAVVSFLFVVLWVTLMFVFSRPESVRGVTISTPPTDKPAASSVVLQGSLNGFDASSGTLSFTWAPMKLSSNGLESFGSSDADKKSIGIYRDVEIVPDTTHTPTSDWQGNLWKVDSEVNPIALVGMHSWDTFTTNIHAQEGGRWLGYPWDSYTASIALVANDHSAATQAGVANSYAITIEDALFTSSPSSTWKVASKVSNTCNDPSNKSCSLFIEFSIQRSPLTITTTILIVLFNWIITLVLLVLSCEAVLLHREIILQDLPLLLISLVALFTLPVIRYTIPSSPPFGGFIDLVGLIPNLFLLVVCVVLLSIHSLQPSIYFVPEPARSGKESV